MDADHRAALLAVSCLHTPVHPRTRVPVARYERERERAAAAGGGLGGEWQDSVSPEREQQSSMHTDCEECIDFSKMYLSNQEYYLKLEELKNAHLETMAKLERMYQTKLYLNGVQPLSNTMDVTHSEICRSTRDKSIFQLQHIHKSFSEPDLSNSFSSNLPDMPDKDLEENYSEDELLKFYNKQIEDVRDELSLEDYFQCTEVTSSKLQTIKKSMKKTEKWSPKVTVPKPFQMTIREAKRKQQNIKSKSLIELENNLLKKQLEEEAECQKKFRANPVPAYVFLPLYHEIMQQNEECRKSLKKKRRELLLSTQKPFRFIDREAQKTEMRKVVLKDLSSPEKVNVFKAKPVPKFVYSSEMNEKLKEEELYRKIRIQMRSEELLQNSSFPIARLGKRGANKQRQRKCFEHNEQLECKPKPKAKVPNFEKLHKKFQEQLQRRKNLKPNTVCEPFSLCTANIPSNKEKILEDIQMDDEKLKETRWPYASSRCNPQIRHLNSRTSPSGYEEPVIPRITQSTRRRLQALRESTEEKRKIEEQKRKTAKQKQKAKELQRLVTIWTEVNEPHQSLAQVYKSKLKTIRRLEKQRMKEYLQDMEEMEERVGKRPLLLEQVTQKNARRAAEKHYTDILQRLGLCEEFVSKKGCATAEKIFEDHDDTRSNEEKVDERESEIGEKPRVESAESEEDGEQKENNTEEEEGDGGKQKDTSEEEDEDEDADAQSEHSDQDAHEYEIDNYEEDLVEESGDSES